jgi:hypothetical protein
MNVSEGSTVLSSWKDIARYLGKGVRTVQRWERHLGLPVRRPNGALQKSAVVLYRGDVDVWLATRFSARAMQKNEAQTIQSTRTTLREGILAARELRAANRELSKEIRQTIRTLRERCEHLNLQRPEDFRLAENASPAESLVPELKTIPDLLQNTSTLRPERIA